MHQKTHSQLNQAAAGRGSADPQAESRNLELQPGGSGVWTIGMVAEAHPFLNCYKVISTVDGAGGTSRVCRMLSGTSLDAFSVRASQVLSVGSHVLCYMPVASPYGLIVGVLPLVANDAATQLPDFWTVGGMSGYNYERLHRILLESPMAMDLANFSEGRSADLSPGDYALMNGLGVGQLISQFLHTLRATDLCRIDLFYIDHLLRIFGHNLEIFSATGELRLKDDEGELIEEERHALYPWEAAGLQAAGDAFREQAFAWDPTDRGGPRTTQAVRQSGFFRRVRYGGYLGLLSREIIQAPNPATAVPETMSAGQMPHFGVFHQHTGADGLYTLRSAKGIILQKTVLLPMPRRIAEPEDPSGDSPQPNATGRAYRASGAFGDGEAHTHQEYQWPSGTDRYARGACLPDFFDYLFNYSSLLPFVRHTGDFEVPEASATRLGELSHDDSEPIGVSLQWAADMPAVGQLKIDHNVASARFYEATSTLALLEDGSTLLQDGFGSWIRMADGNIEISCAKNILLRAGGSVVTLAPRDIVQRAGQSVDISGGKGDVRIKADGNLHCLSGNGGQGGILLESRATGDANAYSGRSGSDVVSSGVTIKSPSSPFVVLSKDAYLRTLSSGNITLDADGNKGRISISARQVVAGCGGFYVAVGGDFESPTSDAMFCVTPGLVNVEATLRASAGIMAEGQIISGADMVASGTIACRALAHTSGPMVSPIQGSSLAPVKKSLKTMSKTAATLKAGVDLSLETEAQRVRGTDESWGSTKFIEDCRFTFRSATQHALYGDTTFILAETPWQQRLRLSGGGKTWDEPPVAGPLGDTYPWPGQELWTAGTAYATVDLQMHDSAARRPKDRTDEAYSAQTPAVVKRVSLATGYLVTGQ